MSCLTRPLFIARATRRGLMFSLVLTLPFALAACEETTAFDSRTAPPLVRVAVVERAATAWRSFTGTVAARVQSDLAFRVSGKVLERLVDTGQVVKRGQPLMRIDPADLKLAEQVQLQAVAAARARAQQTADDEARYRDLLGTGAISDSAYNQIKAAADGAAAQLRAAEAQAEVARNASRYAELLADADGVVIETLAEQGHVVNAGQVVVRVAHAGRREAVVQLPETLRPSVGSAAEAMLFSQVGAAVPARLRQLSDAADRLTRTFEARYVLDESMADAPLGSTVTIRVSDQRPAPEDAVQVPIGSLFDAGNGPGVWVINDDQPIKVSWQPVVVERLDHESARVTGPLEPGDRIVALGAHLLREGQQVRIAGDAVVAVQEATP